MTGTDTGVGKTFVAASLVHALANAGRAAVAIKPIETGCGDGGHEREDGVVLARSTGQSRPREALVRLRAPLTPALAAEREGFPLDIGGLVHTIRDLGQGADVVVVEGAGGLLSPLSWDRDITHVARDLDARVLVVAADRLGAINQVHLTVQVLFDTWLLPTAVILSAPSEPDASSGTNAGALRRRLACFGEVAARIV